MKSMFTTFDTDKELLDVIFSQHIGQRSIILYYIQLMLLVNLFLFILHFQNHGNV